MQAQLRTPWLNATHIAMTQSSARSTAAWWLAAAECSAAVKAASSPGGATSPSFRKRCSSMTYGGGYTHICA